MESPCASGARMAPANVLMLCPFCVSACCRSKAPVTCSTAEPLVQQLLTLPGRYTAQKVQKRKQSGEKMLKHKVYMFGRHVEAKLEVKSQSQRTSLMVLATSMPKLCAMKPCLRNRGDTQNKSAHAQTQQISKTGSIQVQATTRANLIQ